MDPCVGPGVLAWLGNVSPLLIDPDQTPFQVEALWEESQTPHHLNWAYETSEKEGWEKEKSSISHHSTQHIG